MPSNYRMTITICLVLAFSSQAASQDKKPPAQPLDPALQKFKDLGGSFSLKNSTFLYTTASPIGWTSSPFKSYPSVWFSAALVGAPKNLMGLAVTKLNLYGTKVSDADLASLQKLGQLQSLMLNRTPITNKGVAHVAGLTQLKELSLTGTNISDAGLVHIGGLKSLETLVLIETKITDAGLANLKPLANLKALHLNRTNIGNGGLGHLRELKLLQVLGLRGTKVTPAGFAALKGGVPALQIVDLTGAKITDEEEKNIRSFVPKAKIIR